MDKREPMLAIRNLSIAIEGHDQPRPTVCELDLDIAAGETVALVGESGSGKTLIALAILGLLPHPPARVVSGSVSFKGEDLLTVDERRLNTLRGNRISMIFQEPGTSLNPLLPIGPQIAEVLMHHQKLGARAARQQVLMLMEMVGIPDPRRRYRSYPHQLSGGIRQRVMIAMALMCRPDLLLADEPTSALDATVQAQIIDLLSRLIGDLGMSVLLITHNLGIVAALAKRVVVLHAGQVIETGTVRQILKDPLHPYTKALVDVHPFSHDEQSGTRRSVAGDQASSLTTTLSRCPFAALCPNIYPRCQQGHPALISRPDQRQVRCFRWDLQND